MTRPTVAQALVKFLAGQYSKCDGAEQRLIPGAFGIFGHGNVAGGGQALLEVAESGEMPYHLGRNEQGTLRAQTEVLGAVNAEMDPRDVVVQAAGSLPGDLQMLCRARIGALSESSGSQRFGTNYRYRDPETGMLTGEKLPVDLAANAESLGAKVIRVTNIEELRAAIATARAAEHTTAVHIEADPLAPVPSSESWWDVPVSEVAARDSTQQAHQAYEVHKRDQKALTGGAQQ